MKYAGLLVLFFSFTAFIACNKGVSVIFKNETGKDFKTLDVNIRGQQYSFSDIKNGERTKALRVPETYGYCYARAITTTDTLVCQPIDFVGEELYTSGKLVMKLFIPGGGNEKYMGIR